MHLPLLGDILIVLALATALLWLLQRFHVPLLIGFLLTGVVAGPHGLGLVTAVDEITVLSEIGVVLLLFTIGMELTIGELHRVKNVALLGGSVQVVGTIAVSCLLAMLIGFSTRESIFLGMLVSLSSTAIVLKFYQEHGWLRSLHGQATISILIFQDIAVVVMLLASQFLAADGSGASTPSWRNVIVACVALTIVLVVSRNVIPRFLHGIASTRLHELFLLSVIVVGLGVAWLTAEAGLSLALGAFLAGLVIAESPYSEQAIGVIAPFRDLFSSLFFVSIGMLLDMRLVIGNLPLVVGLAAIVILLKAGVAFGAVKMLSYQTGTSIQAGLALGQIGEFSFVLAKAGLLLALLDANTFQLFLAVSALTMAATPFVIALAPRFVYRLGSVTAPGAVRETQGSDATSELKDHLIIAGFGSVGQALANVATRCTIPHIVVDANPANLQIAEKLGEKFLFGDGANTEILHRAGLQRAVSLVVAVSDRIAAKRIVSLARYYAPKVNITVRTPFLHDELILKAAGADQIIVDELQSAETVVADTLRRFRVPDGEIASAWTSWKSTEAGSTDEEDVDNGEHLSQA